MTDQNISITEYRLQKAEEHLAQHDNHLNNIRKNIHDIRDGWTIINSSIKQALEDTKENSDEIFKLKESNTKMSKRVDEIEIASKVKSGIKSFFKSFVYYIQLGCPMVVASYIIFQAIDLEKLGYLNKNPASTFTQSINK